MGWTTLKITALCLPFDFVISKGVAAAAAAELDHDDWVCLHLRRKLARAWLSCDVAYAPCVAARAAIAVGWTSPRMMTGWLACWMT